MLLSNGLIWALTGLCMQVCYFAWTTYQTSQATYDSFR